MAGNTGLKEWQGCKAMNVNVLEENRALYTLALLDIARILKPTGRRVGCSLAFNFFQTSTSLQLNILHACPGAILITTATESNDSAMAEAILSAKLRLVRRLGPGRLHFHFELP